MPLTSTHHSPTTSPARVVIDCSRVSASTVTEDSEVARLLEWIRSYPRRSDIAIVVGNALRNQQTRRLQNTFQALGCQVVMRIALAAH